MIRPGSSSVRNHNVKLFCTTLIFPVAIAEQCVPIVNFNKTEKALTTVQQLYDAYKAGNNDSIYDFNQTISADIQTFTSTADRSYTQASVVASVHAPNGTHTPSTTTHANISTNSSSNTTAAPILIIPTILDPPVIGANH